MPQTEAWESEPYTSMGSGAFPMSLTGLRKSSVAPRRVEHSSDHRCNSARLQPGGSTDSAGTSLPPILRNLRHTEYCKRDNAPPFSSCEDCHVSPPGRGSPDKS